MSEPRPLLAVRGAGHRYGDRYGCRDVDFELWPGEVLAVVGESGSGKSTLLGTLSRRLALTEGSIQYTMADGETVELGDLSESTLRRLWRSEWGFVHQDAADGLRMHVSAGGNVGEPLMATGWRHYGRSGPSRPSGSSASRSRWTASTTPRPTFSGGMRQRLQIARNLVVSPRLVFMDEPTSGLDVSVQARLLDLIRSLVAELGLAVVIVTHDLAVARLISHRTLVMQGGRVIESGLTDRVLDDPQAAYTQLLVSSILQG